MRAQITGKDRIAKIADDIIRRVVEQVISNYQQPCVCGCGQTLPARKSVFLQGHDSKLRAEVKNTLRGMLAKSASGKLDFNATALAKIANKHIKAA